MTQEPLKDLLTRYYSSGIADDVIRHLNLNADQMATYLACGLSSYVFKISDTEVVKITNKDHLNDVGFTEELINHSSILQPTKEKEIRGLYIIATYPLLRTKGVTKEHRATLKEIFDKDDLDFTDDKLENIGLTKDGTPMVIDRDAVIKKPEPVKEAGVVSSGVDDTREAEEVSGGKEKEIKKY